MSRPRFNHATVVAYLALFVALGGSSYAALTITGKNVKDGSLTGRDVRNSSLTGADLKNNSVGSVDIKNGDLLARDFKSGQLPAGAQGPKGDSGAQGPPGAQGVPGSDLTAVCAGNDPADVMVKVGPMCLDRYEASVWSSPTGGTQYGVGSADYPCNVNGQNCTNIYARSVAGVTPSAFITWFQAQQALVNSGKRLPSNAEWQVAVAGTPGGCFDLPGVVPVTGARAECVSNHGTNDMTGNLAEWVADWDEQADGCVNYPIGPPDFGTDRTCFGDGTPSRFPGALVRGGHSQGGTTTGAFAVDATNRPSDSSTFIGFRGAR